MYEIVVMHGLTHNPVGPGTAHSSLGQLYEKIMFCSSDSASAKTIVIVIFFHKEGVDIGNMTDLIREKLKTGNSKVDKNVFFFFILLFILLFYIIF